MLCEPPSRLTAGPIIDLQMVTCVKVAPQYDSSKHGKLRNRASFRKLLK